MVIKSRLLNVTKQEQLEIMNAFDELVPQGQRTSVIFELMDKYVKERRGDVQSGQLSK